jgi:hypothetical protein
MKGLGCGQVECAKVEYGVYVNKVKVNKKENRQLGLLFPCSIDTLHFFLLPLFFMDIVICISLWKIYKERKRHKKGKNLCVDTDVGKF